MKKIIREWKVYVDKELLCIEHEDRILETLRLLKELFKDRKIEVQKYYHELSAN